MKTVLVCIFFIKNMSYPCRDVQLSYQLERLSNKYTYYIIKVISSENCTAITEKKKKKSNDFAAYILSVLNIVAVNDTVNLTKIIEFFKFYSLQRLHKKKTNNVSLNAQVNLKLSGTGAQAFAHYNHFALLLEDRTHIAPCPVYDSVFIVSAWLSGTWVCHACPGCYTLFLWQCCSASPRACSTRSALAFVQLYPISPTRSTIPTDGPSPPVISML